MRVVAILPARGGSRRLPGKNLATVLGKPLLAWIIDAVRCSRHLDLQDLWVSTDDEAIANEARARGAGVLHREAALAGPEVWTEPVIQDAVERLETLSGKPVDLVVWLNACLPEIEGGDIDRAIDWLLRDGLREVISVGDDGRTHSAVRVLRRETLFQNRLSVHAGILRLPYVDIHTAEDLARAESRLRIRLGSKQKADVEPSAAPGSVRRTHSS